MIAGAGGAFVVVAPAIPLMQRWLREDSGRVDPRTGSETLAADCRQRRHWQRRRRRHHPRRGVWDDDDDPPPLHSTPQEDHGTADQLV